jgi:hypothetical protein
MKTQWVSAVVWHAQKETRHSGRAEPLRAALREVKRGGLRPVGTLHHGVEAGRGVREIAHTFPGKSHRYV